MRTKLLAVLVLAVTVIVSASTLGAAAAPTPAHPRAVSIVVRPRSVAVDEPLHVVVKGLPPRSRVAVGLTLDTGSFGWASEATFAADRHGRVDLAKDAPLSGDYRGVDPMGLVWSAHLTGTTTPPPGHIPWTDTLHLHASVAGTTVATADVTRYYLKPGGRAVAVRTRGLVGTLFEPPGTGRHPGVIVFGGSEGGKTTTELIAALLASHGYSALALAYFDLDGVLPGLPTTLSMIPLEYFTTAISWLGEQPSVDPDRLAVMGASRGGELALLLGTRHPQLKAVIASAPSSVVWSGLPNFTQAAWTEGGQPVPFLVPEVGVGPTGYGWYFAALTDPNANPAATIPVEQISGPVLVINGADDELWPSQLMARMVMQRLRQHHHPFNDLHLSSPHTGHIVPFPYEPTARAVGPGIGGNAAGAAHGGADAWKQTLRFLQRALRR